MTRKDVFPCWCRRRRLDDGRQAVARGVAETARAPVLVGNPDLVARVKPSCRATGLVLPTIGPADRNGRHAVFPGASRSARSFDHRAWRFNCAILRPRVVLMVVIHCTLYSGSWHRRVLPRRWSRAMGSLTGLGCRGCDCARPACRAIFIVHNI